MDETKKKVEKRKRDDSLDSAAVAEKEEKQEAQKMEKWFIFTTKCQDTESDCSGEHRWVWSASQVAQSDSITTIATAFETDHPGELIPLDLECECRPMEKLIRALGELYSRNWESKVCNLQSVENVQTRRICERIRKYHSEPTAVFLKVLQLYHRVPFHRYRQYMTVLTFLPEKSAHLARIACNQWLWSQRENNGSLIAQDMWDDWSGETQHSKMSPYLDPWIHETGLSELIVGHNTDYPVREESIPSLLSKDYFRTEVLNPHLWTPDVNAPFSWGPCNGSAMDLVSDTYPKWLEPSDFRPACQVAVFVLPDVAQTKEVLATVVSWIHPEAVCFSGKNSLYVFRVGQKEWLHIRLVHDYRSHLFTRAWNSGFYDVVHKMLYYAPGWLQMVQQKRLTLSGFVLYENESIFKVVSPLLLRGFAISVHWQDVLHILPKDCVIPTLTETLSKPNEWLPLKIRLDPFLNSVFAELHHGPTQLSQLLDRSQWNEMEVFKSGEWKDSDGLLASLTLHNCNQDDDGEEVPFEIESERYSSDTPTEQKRFVHPVRILDTSKILSPFAVSFCNPSKIDSGSLNT